jgi:phosphoglycolate phosphatase-like HAD superfamily hydrolase
MGQGFSLRGCGVVFDLDGTLIDSWHVASEAFCFAFRSTTGRADPPVADFTARLGLPFEQILFELGLPEQMRVPFVEFSQAHAHTIRPYEGIVLELAALRAAGARLGIVTGKDRKRAKYLLCHTHLARYFDALITPDDAPGKPDPRCLFECLKRLQCSRSYAVYVGDSLSDMQCGKRAFVLRVFARWGALRAVDIAEYDLIAETPQQLSAILVSWSQSQGCWAAMERRAAS